MVNVVREMDEKDLDSVARLSGELGYPVSTAVIRARYLGIVADEQQQCFVIENDANEVVGWIHVVIQQRLESDSYLEIGGLVVGSATRRRGLGKRLVDEAKVWARSKNIGVIRVRSNISREEAHHFYPGLKFERIKTQHNYQLKL